MKNRLITLMFVIIVMISMTSCTRYASNAPTPEVTQPPTMAIDSPTLLPIDVLPATRTPFPIILQTTTPTESISEILTQPVDATISVESKNPTLVAFLKETGAAKTMMAGTPNPIFTQAALQSTNSLTYAGTAASLLTTTANPSGAIPTRMPVVVISGKPTIAIVHVAYASSITVQMSNFDPNIDLVIRMGSPAAYGADGPVVDTVHTDANGNAEGVFKIPEKFIGYGQIEFRVELPNGYPFYFLFYNNNY